MTIAERVVHDRNYERLLAYIILKFYLLITNFLALLYEVSINYNITEGDSDYIPYHDGFLYPLKETFL